MSRLVSDIASADVFVLNGVIPEASAIQARIEQGAGLVLILGPDLSASNLKSLLGVSASLEYKESPLSLDDVSNCL